MRLVKALGTSAVVAAAFGAVAPRVDAQGTLTIAVPLGGTYLQLPLSPAPTTTSSARVPQ